jgi:hypothetical protein
MHYYFDHFLPSFPNKNSIFPIGACPLDLYSASKIRAQTENMGDIYIEIEKEKKADREYISRIN